MAQKWPKSLEIHTLDQLFSLFQWNTLTNPKEKAFLYKIWKGWMMFNFLNSKGLSVGPDFSSAL